MSDDDLWRRPQEQPHDADQAEKASASGGDAHAAHDPGPVSDETQPISGTGGTPPPSPPPSSPQPGPPFASPSGPGPVPPPANPYGQATGQPAQHPAQGQPQGQPQGWNPYVDPHAPGAGYGQPPTTPYPQGGYGHPGPGYAPPQNPYPQPNEYGSPQSPYGSPYQPAYAGGLVPSHGSATTAMVLGIVGLVSIVVCAGLLLVVSPVAWILGGKAVKEIDASPGRYSGRDRAQAGRIMGIIGTVLLVLGVLAIILVVILAANSDPTYTPSNNQNF
jgi:hypothetical protein